MKKLAFFTAIIVGSWTNFGLNTSYAWANKANKQIKLVKLNNLNNSSLEVFLDDDNLIQNISTKNAELNLSFDASNLINNTTLPTSFKIEIYDVTTNKRLLGIVRPSIFNERRVSNFKTNIELANLTKSSTLEINIYNSKNNFFASYNATIVIENQSGISFTELEAADCAGEFGKCQLEYIFQNVHFTTLPSKGLKTKVEQNTDGSYSVNLPLIQGKKNIKVKNIFGNANGDSGSSGNQDFSFDFDGSNLFVIKDGVTTLVAAQGPAGEKGDSGAAGPKGDDGAFSGGDTNINGTLTFTSNGKLQDAILNGTSLVTTNNLGEIPLIIRGAAAQTANLQEWQDSAGTVLSQISAGGLASIKGGLFSYSAEGGFGASLVAGGAGTPRSLMVGYVGSANTQLSSNAILGWTNATDVYANIDTGFARNAAGIVEINNGTSGQWAALRVGSQAAATQPLIVKGAASQTANLTEWQNSAGTVVASVSPTGVVTTKDVSDTSSGANRLGYPYKYYESLAFYHNSTLGSSIGEQLLLETTTGISMFNTGKIKWSSGTHFYETPDAGIARYAAGIIEINNGTSGQWAALRVGSQAAATQPLIVKGAASQTAKLQEWQNSAGATLAYVDYNGGLESSEIHSGLSWLNTSGNCYFQGTSYFRHTSTGVVSSDISGATGAARFILQSASAIGVLIKGAAAQTANLQEWQDSPGTVLASVSPAGDIEITDPTRGIILRSPNGTRWRIQVTNAGSLTTTSL